MLVERESRPRFDRSKAMEQERRLRGLPNPLDRLAGSLVAQEALPSPASITEGQNGGVYRDCMVKIGWRWSEEPVTLPLAALQRHRPASKTAATCSMKDPAHSEANVSCAFSRRVPRTHPTHYGWLI
jgi:hypothetical protein